jgi:hypothetical protein
LILAATGRVWDAPRVPDHVVLHRDPVLCVAEWRNVFFEIWLGAGSDVSHQRTLWQLHREAIARARPTKVALLVRVRLEGAASVPDEMRREAAARHREIDPDTLAMAIVLDDKGFGASVVRSLISSIMFVSGGRAPSKVCRSMDEAFEYLAPRIGGDASANARQLRAVYQAVIGER